MLPASASPPLAGNITQEQTGNHTIHGHRTSGPMAPPKPYGKMRFVDASFKEDNPLCKWFQHSNNEWNWYQDCLYCQEKDQWSLWRWSPHWTWRQWFTFIDWIGERPSQQSSSYIFGNHLLRSRIIIIPQCDLCPYIEPLPAALTMATTAILCLVLSSHTFTGISSTAQHP
jgi:hypothetical protein